MKTKNEIDTLIKLIHGTGDIPFKNMPVEVIDRLLDWIDIPFRNMPVEVIDKLLDWMCSGLLRTEAERREYAYCCLREYYENRE